MGKSICESCFHYAACSAIDVTGVVGNPKCEPENLFCEHFIHRDRVKIQDKAHWIEDIKRYNDGDVFVTYFCSHCNQMEYVKSYKGKEWDDYYRERYRDNIELSNFCRKCGSVVECIF